MDALARKPLQRGWIYGICIQVTNVNPEIFPVNIEATRTPVLQVILMHHYGLPTNNPEQFIACQEFFVGPSPRKRRSMLGRRYTHLWRIRVVYAEDRIMQAVGAKVLTWQQIFTLGRIDNNNYGLYSESRRRIRSL